MSVLAAGAGLLERVGSRLRGTAYRVGVEVDFGSVRVAGCSRGRDAPEWSLVDLELPVAPAAGPSGEDRVGDRIAAGRLRRAARQAGVRPGDAVCALNSPAIDIIPLNVSRAAAVPLEQAVIEQARQHLGDQVEEAILDFSVLPESAVRPAADRAAVLLFVTRRQLVEDVLQTLQAVGLAPERLLTPACVLAPRVVREDAGQRFLLVGTGLAATSISVVQDGNVLFERILPWGFRSLIERLRSELGLAEGQCRLLLEQGFSSEGRSAAPAGSQGQALRQVLEPDFQELARQAAGCLGYCDSFFLPARITSVVMTGPVAGCSPLGDVLRKGLGIPVRGPRQGLDLPDLGPGGESGAFVTAASCALWPQESPP